MAVFPSFKVCLSLLAEVAGKPCPPRWDGGLIRFGRGTFEGGFLKLWVTEPPELRFSMVAASEVEEVTLSL